MVSYETETVRREMSAELAKVYNYIFKKTMDAQARGFDVTGLRAIAVKVGLAMRQAQMPLDDPSTVRNVHWCRLRIPATQH